MFDDMVPAKLTALAAGAIPNAQGVYQLFHFDKLVYIGKTESDDGLAKRLHRHARTIQSRHRLNVDEMKFKAVQVLVFSAMDLEKALIKHYRSLKMPPTWNGSGFGNADPGRKRDATALKEDGFDANYPINIDLELDAQWTKDASAFDVIGVLASKVPYTIRHDKSPNVLTGLKNSRGVLLPNPLTIRSGLTEVCAALPSGWQATRLSGRVIFYHDHMDDYPGAEIISRS